MISITELIAPPQIRALSVAHETEVVEDAGDRIWALLGTLLHGVLERNAKGLKDTISEEQLETEILGWKVIGHYDLSEMVLDGECLTDWKLTSVWSVKDGVKREWAEQLNCYAQLIRLAGRTVNQLQIVAVGRDWSKSKARFDASYPQQQVKVMPVILWPQERAREFMEERVILHQNAEAGHIEECTSEERWARPTQYALSKEGAKKAIRVMTDGIELMKYAINEGLTDAEGVIREGYLIAERPGESVRCVSYCSVAPFCPQWKRIQHESTRQS